MIDNKYRECYTLGVDAFHSGDAMKDCPFDSRLNPDEHRAWCIGFVEAEVSQYTYA